MQFEQIDVELGGTSLRQTIGPMSSGLNAIVGPRGSGKTQLRHWLRRTIAESIGHSPNGFYAGAPSDLDAWNDSPGRSTLNSSIQGSVDVRNHGVASRWGVHRNGSVIELASEAMRGPSGLPTGFHPPRPLSARQRQAFDLLSSVDDVPNAAAVLDDAAVRLGLEIPADYSSFGARDQLVARERELVERLERLSNIASASREELLSRRRDVEHQLAPFRSNVGFRVAGSNSDFHRRADRYSAIEADLRGALAEIDQYDRELAEIKAELKVSEIGCQTVHIDSSYREQLQQLEDRLNRWRQTLRDIRSHRESIEHDETDAVLDEQTGTQLSGTLHADSRGPIRSLEAQLHNARKQLDQLVVQYGYSPIGAYPQSTDYPYAGSPGPTTVHWSPAFLPETLRSMQKDLHEICHHLSRYEARAASKTLQQQVQQLRRCETELLQSVERLIEQRGVLLRKIADKYHLTSEQLSLAFGDWCQCNDHPHLADWLLREEALSQSTYQLDGQHRTVLLERIARIEADRKEALLRAEECRRQLREIDPSRLTVGVQPVVEQVQTQEVELSRELDRLTAVLNELDSRDRLRAELDGVRRELSKLPSTPVHTSEYRQAVSRHIVGLSGTSYLQNGNCSAAGPATFSSPYSATSYYPNREFQVQVPSQLAGVAQRLAIAGVLASRGEPVSVILDQTLDGLDHRILRASIEYLSRLEGRPQVIILTEDQRVIDAVREVRGAVHFLKSAASSPSPEADVNQILTAYANDEESAKWYRPLVEDAPLRGTRQFYLSEESLVEEHPSIPATVAARLRSLGIDRVGDLLESDPVGLSRRLRIDRLTEVTICNWQSVADLLCHVAGMRPFDARVLVGAGVRNSRELSTRHPGQLFDRVERFLATDTGRKILRSGSSYELSRITSWIAAAKQRTVRTYRDDTDRLDEYGHDPYDGHGTRMPRYDDAPNQRHSRDFPRNGDARSHRRPSNQPGEARRSHRRSTARRSSARTYPAVSNGTYTVESNGAKTRGLRFYLELASPVVDAPSIGQKIGERLNQHGVFTVEQLLASNSEQLAKKLAHRRISADTVRAWQDQSRLVCRIPNLRGHDAQMLVACKIATPELLASLNAENVLAQVLAFARSSEGERVLRGGKEPDLAEVNNWIAWASQSRALNAA